jgi:hypothetical protein
MSEEKKPEEPKEKKPEPLPKQPKPQEVPGHPSVPPTVVVPPDQR